MAYVNNGTERSLKINVYKKVGGNYVQGYPKVYDGQESWGNPTYPTLTDSEFRQLSDVDFTARYSAFQAYVATLEPGINFSTDIVGDGATRVNTGVCLPVSTTTTTAAVTVYSFTVRYALFPTDACTGTIASVYSDKAVPQVGDFLYKDYNLTQPWDVDNAGSMLFISPTIYGAKTILVAIVDTSEYELGEIIDILNGYDCGAVVDITTTTIAPNPEIQVIDNNTPSVIIEGQEPIDITTAREGHFQLMFTINNIGTTELTISNASLDNTDEFTLVVDPSLGGAIQPGMSRTGLVRYGSFFSVGAANNIARCLITIESDAVNDSNFSFSIKYDDVS